MLTQVLFTILLLAGCVLLYELGTREAIAKPKVPR
jgi:hypothetical protein